MSTRTVKRFGEIVKQQARADAASSYLGCTCSNPACKLTWIVCQLPQPIATLTKLTGKHTHCPNCMAPQPKVARTVDVRALLTWED